MMVVVLSSCTTLPTGEFEKFEFPNDAFFGTPERPHEIVTVVKIKVNFSSLDPDREEAVLCNNYFNKAVANLIKQAKDKNADAVSNVQSVVYLYDGRKEMYPKAECADDGQEGQVLVQAAAIKWAKPAKGGVD